MNFTRNKVLWGVAVLAAAVAASYEARAGVPVTWEAINAPGTCQGALPAFAGTLRFRPLAVQNEGTSTAFVTCSIASGSSSTGKQISRVAVTVANFGSTTRDVTCTLVDGAYGGAQYVTQTVTLTPSAGSGINFFANGLPQPSTYFFRPNVSCQLPPGVALHDVAYEYVTL